MSNIIYYWNWLWIISLCLIFFRRDYKIVITEIFFGLHRYQPLIILINLFFIYIFLPFTLIDTIVKILKD